MDINTSVSLKRPMLLNVNKGGEILNAILLVLKDYL